MEKVAIDLKKWKSEKEDVDHILLSGRPIDPNKLSKVKRLYREYQIDKKNKKLLERIHHQEESVSFTLDKEEVLEKLLKLITKDEVIDYCVCLDNKAFTWEIEPDSLTKNIFNNRQDPIWIPVEDEKGEYSYLNKKYKKKVCDLW